MQPLLTHSSELVWDVISKLRLLQLDYPKGWKKSSPPSLRVNRPLLLLNEILLKSLNWIWLHYSQNSVLSIALKLIWRISSLRCSVLFLSSWKELCKVARWSLIQLLLNKLKTYWTPVLSSYNILCFDSGMCFIIQNLFSERKAHLGTGNVKKKRS